MKRTLNGEAIQCLKMLKQHKKHFETQIFRTLKGQILSGNVDGFRRGFHRIMKGGEEN